MLKRHLVLDQDLPWIARTAYGEARGEGYYGMRLVAEVIINRMKDRRWPKTAKGVVLQKWQFSCWNSNDPNREAILSVNLHNPFYREAYHATINAAKMEDISKGANHYFSMSIKMPWWAKKMKHTLTYGRHRFYKDG